MIHEPGGGKGKVDGEIMFTIGFNPLLLSAGGTVKLVRGNPLSITALLALPEERDQYVIDSF